MGRPSSYNEELANRICEKISTSSKGLNAICKEGEMPDPATVYRWINENEEFCKKYARAREMQAEFLLEEIIDIADDDQGDIMQGGEGAFPNGVNVQRSRLKTDVRKWAASKLYPKKFSEKIQTEITGKIQTETPDLSNLTDAELATLIELQSKIGTGKA